jgi:tripartite-type tricarboxylate transporter receptor subunit TctC
MELRMPMIKRLATLLAVALAVALPAPSPAQGFPSKTVTIVVPYAPGGGHDAMARMLAERLTSRLGQTVIVENRAGANGMIGAEHVSRAAPDGHTILFASPAEIVIAPSAYKSMRYDPMKDLLPVTLAGITPLVIVAHPSTGVKNLPELIALAKAKPRTLSFGTAGNASSQHLAGEWLNNLAGIDLQHVAYKGAGPATTDVLGGQIPFAIVGMAPVLPHIRQGKLVPVAVTTKDRVQWAKDVATVAETPGMKDFEVSHWMGVLVPAKTPPEIVDRLQSEIAAVLGTPDFRERLTALGVDPVGNTPAAFRDYLAAEKDRFARMYKLAGLTPE